MKPIDVKSNNYVNYNVTSNDEDPKFPVGNNLRISKYKNIFAKGYTTNWSEELFVIRKKNNIYINTVLWTYVTIDLNGKEVAGTFYEKELQKADQLEFSIGKVIKKKGNKLSFNLFNGWIDTKDIV